MQTKTKELTVAPNRSEIKQMKGEWNKQNYCTSQINEKKAVVHFEHYG